MGLWTKQQIREFIKENKLGDAVHFKVKQDGAIVNKAAYMKWKHAGYLRGLHGILVESV